MEQVPAIILKHLSDAQKKAYRIADNKLTEIVKWDFDLLNIEFENLSNIDLSFDLNITGFETSEIDFIIEKSPNNLMPKRMKSPKHQKQSVKKETSGN